MASWYPKHCSFCVPLINYILHNKVVLGYKFIYFIIYIPYFLAHKMHREFFVTNFRKKNDECILIFAIYWKKTGLLHTKISNHNIIYSS